MEEKGKVQSEEMTAESARTLLQQAFQGDEATDLGRVQWLMDLAAKALNMDKVILLENRDYLYCFKPTYTVIRGRRAASGREINLSKNQYQNLLSVYKNHMVTQLRLLSFGDNSDVLHCGLILGDYIYGILTFRSLTPRVWTPAEADVLVQLSKQIFPYVCNRYNQADKIMERLCIAAGANSRTVDIYYIDIPEKECHTIKMESDGYVNVDEWKSYDEGLTDYCNLCVEASFARDIYKKFYLKNLLAAFAEGESTVSLDYPRIIEGVARWFRMTARLVERDANQQSKAATLIVDDITDVIKDTERESQLYRSMETNYLAIVNVDLNMNRYVILEDTDGFLGEDYPRMGDYKQLLRDYYDNKVYERDKAGFIRNLGVEHLKRVLDNGDYKQTMDFRYNTGDGNQQWVRTELFANRGYNERNRTFTIYVRDIDAEAANKGVIDNLHRTLSNVYHAVYQIFLDDMSWTVIKTLDHVRAAYNAEDDASTVFEKICNVVVAPQHLEMMLRFGDFSTVAERLKGRDHLSIEYINQLNMWCRASLIPSGYNEAGELSSVLYAVSDINSDKQRALELADAKQQLEAERSIGRDMAYKLEHDPLTNAYNRIGMERLLVPIRDVVATVAFGLVDIDRFKTINDTYGHLIGDMVLVKVSNLLRRFFRKSDFVARIGGDEFALIITNFDMSRKDFIKDKLREVNNLLSEDDGEVPPVSISAGIAYSSAGYHKGLYTMADRALYDVKTHGRGSCADYTGEHLMKDAEGHSLVHSDISQPILAEKAEGSALTLTADMTKDVMVQNMMGVYRIEMPANGRPRLYIDEALAHVFGVPVDMGPEDCFEYWNKGIDHDYRNLVENAVAKILETGHAEVIYPWYHPLRGKTVVRCGGTSDPNFLGGQCIIGYHQEINLTHVERMQDDRGRLLNALSDIYYCCYYIDLENDSYTVYNGQHGDSETLGVRGRVSVGLASFVDGLVVPAFRKRMRQFLDMGTIGRRMKGREPLVCEYVGIMPAGWNRAKLIPVRRDASGQLTHVAFVVISIHEQKSRELEQLQMIDCLKQNFRLIVHFDIVGDIYSALTTDDDLRNMLGNSGKVISKVKEVIASCVVDEYQEQMKAFLSAETVAKRMHYTDFLYEDFIDRKRGWMRAELAISKRDETGRATFVLLTVRDINDEKRKERIISFNAEHDTLTGVLNQLGYEEYLKSLRLKQEPLVYMLLRIADYQKLYQRYGVEICDRIVMKTVAFLKTRCPSNAVMYRCEQDELVVIIENWSENEGKQLRGMLDRLSEKLRHPYAEIPPASYEAGVVYAAHGFEEDLMRKAYDTIEYNRHQGKDYSAYNDNIKYNKSVLYSEWLRLKNENKSLLRMVDGPLVEYCFIGVCDMETEEYGVLMTKELAEVKLPMHGRLADFAKYMSNYVIDGEVGATMDKYLTKDMLNKHFGYGRDRIVYEFNSVVNPDKWVRMQLVCLERSNGRVVKMLAAARYISEDKQSEKLERKISSMLYQRVYKFIGIIDVNTDTLTVEKDASYEQMCAVGHEYKWSFIEKTISEQKIYPESMELFCKQSDMNYVQEQLEHRNSYTFAYKYVRGDGQSFLLERTYQYLDKERGLIVIAVEDVTEKAHQDSLTSLRNLEGFLGDGEEFVRSGTSNAILYFNIKDFKTLNEMMGISFGNEVLVRFGNILSRSSMNPAVVARSTADSFLLLVDRDDLDYHEIQNLCHFTIMRGKQDVAVSAYCGVYMQDDNAMELRNMCDRAKIAASKIVNNLVCPYAVYDSSMEQELVDKNLLVSEVNEALAAGSFKVYYQPVYNAKTRKLSSAEALVRWQHPEHGIIPPNRFIPALEETGYVSQVDEYVYNNVYGMLEGRRQLGRTILPVSVNLSRMDLLNEPMLDRLVEHTRLSSLNAEVIRFEITESAYMDISNAGLSFMQRLHEMGSYVLIDDFGTGYSSFGNLLKQEFDRIKLDLSYVEQIGSNVKSEVLISSIIDMAHRLGSKVIAEGVETEEQYEFLRDAGCDFVQGYLFSKPVPESEFMAMMDEAAE